MLAEDEIIKTFIQLVETQRTLFANCEAELEQLCASLPLDREQMSDAIAEWCASYPEIDQALDSSSESDRVPGSQGDAPPPPDPKLYQEMLQNTIRRQQKPPKKKP